MITKEQRNEIEVVLRQLVTIDDALNTALSWRERNSVLIQHGDIIRKARRVLADIDKGDGHG